MPLSQGVLGLFIFLGGFEAGRLKSRDIKMFEAHFEPGQGLKEAPVRNVKKKRLISFGDVMKQVLKNPRLRSLLLICFI